MAEETKQEDPNAGKRAPLPEKIDHTKAAITAEQVKKFEDAAPKADLVEEGNDGHAEKHASKGHKK